MTMMALVDADAIKWKVSAAGQKNTIIASHPSGVTHACKNKTEFWGNHNKKEGGWLGEYNKDKTSPLLPTEWVIEDIVTPEPIQNVMHSARVYYDNFVASSGCKKSQGFIGVGKSFREDRSTLIKYKGNRDGAVHPVYLEEVVDYLVAKKKCKIVTGIETDDKLVMEAYKKKDKVILGLDKDYYAQPALVFNPDRSGEGIINCDCFGKLYLNDKGDVKGYGRLFLYFQISSGDSIDNYFANSATDTKWGDKSAYKLLVNTTNDKEALEAVVNIYNKLYPEPKLFTGWRGDELNIDWKYVLQENLDLARMIRYEGDSVNVLNLLNKVGIRYE